MKLPRMKAGMQAVLAIAAVITGGCSMFQSGPGATVEQFYTALNDGEVTTAMDLISSQFRGQIGEDKLRAALSQGTRQSAQEKGGMSSIEILSEDVQGEVATVRVRMEFGDGSSNETTENLVLEDGQWKLQPNMNK